MIEKFKAENSTQTQQIKKLENSEERCNSDLRDQKTSFTSMEGRYNLLIESEFYHS